MPQADDLVVFSHLRWDWVWQRPQHLLSRLGAHRRLWFVEEPRTATVRAPRVRVHEHGCARRVVLELPDDDVAPGVHVGFDDDLTRHYAAALAHLRERPGLVTWLYTPLALPLAEALDPELLVFDIMDDLASFQGASPKLRRRHVDAIGAADVVFTGGRSLHRAALAHRRSGVHCFPSGVELDHYARARALRERTTRRRPVAGYVGVVDERLDLGLVAGLAERMPDWDLDIIGPVAKIDPGALPRRTNLRYRGAVPYERLPETMATLDVALMPFALNDATRAISPTKTLEYLAADLPVVSTRVPDVVSDYAAVVSLADDPAGFEHACRIALVHDAERRRARVAPLLARQEWDVIARSMAALMHDARRRAGGRASEATTMGRAAS